MPAIQRKKNEAQKKGMRIDLNGSTTFQTKTYFVVHNSVGMSWWDRGHCNANGSIECIERKCEMHVIQMNCEHSKKKCSAINFAQHWTRDGTRITINNIDNFLECVSRSCVLTFISFDRECF